MIEKHVQQSFDLISVLLEVKLKNFESVCSRTQGCCAVISTTVASLDGDVRATDL